MTDAMEQPCYVCTRPTGDHTLREWATCAQQPHTHAPYQDAPQDNVAAFGGERLQEALATGAGPMVADGVVVKAIAIDTPIGRIGAVVHDFTRGVPTPGHPDEPVCSVMYLGGDAEGLRRYGTLVRDCANGAAKAAT